MLQLEGAHGSCETSALGIVHPTGTGVEITGTVSIATACCIDELSGRIGWRLIELPFCIDEGSATTKGDDDLTYAPVVDLLGSREWVGDARECVALPFIDLQDGGTPQEA